MRHAADVGGGVLHVARRSADLGVGGVEAAGFHDAALPLGAVDVERDERADLHDRLGRGKVLLGGRASKRFSAACLAE